MIFSGIPFLYYFFPVVLALYFLSPNKTKNLTLFFASLIFYAWGEPVYVVLMIFSTIVDYSNGILVEKFKAQQKIKLAKLVVASSIIINLGLLGFFKYSDFLIMNINSVFGIAIPLLNLGLPIGISFYTFQTMSYTIDVYRGQAQAQKDIISFGAYVTLFPQLIAGPIVRYTDIGLMLNSRTHSLSGFSKGAFRFTVGLGKKVLIANLLGEFCTKYMQANEVSVIFAWAWAIAFSLQIYFDFSGYSDMAIGLGKIFGFDFPENFNYPYISKSITEFWRRWHMTLGSWFRDYLYIPLGGNRVNFSRWIFNIAVVWFATGLWHGASWNFIIWGIYFAIFLLLEKLIINKFLAKMPKFISHIYLLFFIIISFVIFNTETVGDFTYHIGNMFGNATLINAETIYYLKSYAIIFIVAFIGATPLVHNLAKKVKGERLKAVLTAVIMVMILFVTTAFLVEGSFNPFLYFRF